MGVYWVVLSSLIFIIINQAVFIFKKYPVWNLKGYITMRKIRFNWKDSLIFYGKKNTYHKFIPPSCVYILNLNAYTACMKSCSIVEKKIFSAHRITAEKKHRDGKLQLEYYYFFIQTNLPMCICVYGKKIVINNA